MKTHRRLVSLGVLTFCCLWASQAQALGTLKGQEARDFVGDPKAHFIGHGYTAEILKRSHRDSMHGRFSDGVLFNAGGGLFTYPRRKDGDHRILLDTSDGREEEPVTEEFWRRDVENTLSDDNPEPIVFLDDQGKELAVLFIGRGTKANGKINTGGFLEIELNVDGAKEVTGRRRKIG